MATEGFAESLLTLLELIQLVGGLGDFENYGFGDKFFFCRGRVRR